MVFWFIFILVIWIDVVDLGSEGKWVLFLFGKIVNYFFWDGGELNNYDLLEYCVFIFNGGIEKWFDGNCISSFNFMCKKKISVWIFYYLFLLDFILL